MLRLRLTRTIGPVSLVLVAFGAGVLGGLQPASAAEPTGVWSAELGGFDQLEDAVAFAEDDIWAVGDGIVHYDGDGWQQVAGFERPTFHGIDGLSSEQLWVVGETGHDACDRYGFVMRRDGATWRAEPIDTHEPLFDIAIVSEDDGWAVGGLLVPVILHYDGTRWQSVGAPETGGLRAVHMLDADSGWAVGARGAIVRYDGRDWIEAPSPTWATLLDVHMFTEDVGWAVGVSDQRYGTGIILAYEDGQWIVDTDQSTPPLAAVRTLGPQTAVAVGYAGVIEYFDGLSWREIGRTYPGGYTTSGGDAVTEATSAGGAGATARRLALPVARRPSRLADATARLDRALLSRPKRRLPGDTASGAPRPDGGGMPDALDADELANMLRGLALLRDGETLLAVGDAGQIVEIVEESWSEVHGGRLLTAIDMLSTTEGWAVGPNGPPMRWDGTEWRAYPVPRRASWLRDVETLAPDDAWAVGENGVVAHWDGDRWTQWPRFTTRDLTSVAFSAPDDGWIVANHYDERGGIREAYILHWDGGAWEQALHLCSTYISDVLAVSPTEAWFSAAGSWLLRYDGQAWLWVPILGHERPDGPAPIVNAMAPSPGGAWGYGYGWLARLRDGVWRAAEAMPVGKVGPYEDPYQYAYSYAAAGVAASDDASLWALVRYWQWKEDDFGYGGRGEEAWEVRYRRLGEPWDVAHRQDIALTDIAAVAGPDGAVEVWAVGDASTIVHFAASAPDASLPEPTATPRLPAPAIVATPTPRSSMRPDDAREIALAIAGRGGAVPATVEQLELITWGSIPDRLADFSSDRFRSVGTSWYGYGDEPQCHSWRPMWLAIATGEVRCSYYYDYPPSHMVLLLDGATGQLEAELCFAEIRDWLYLPLTVGGVRHANPTPGLRPTSVPRNITPQPVSDVPGPCPTVTPYPTYPPGGYPAP